MDTVGPSVKVRFVLREDEIASAYRTLSLKRPLFWVVLLIGVYFLVQGALDLRGGDVLGNASIHFAGGLFLVGMIATIVFIYPRWQFRRNARARGEQSHEFSDEGFEVSLSDSRSVAKWTLLPAGYRHRRPLPDASQQSALQHTSAPRFRQSGRRGHVPRNPPPTHQTAHGWRSRQPQGYGH